MIDNENDIGREILQSLKGIAELLVNVLEHVQKINTGNTLYFRIPDGLNLDFKTKFTKYYKDAIGPDMFGRRTSIYEFSPNSFEMKPSITAIKRMIRELG